MTWRRLRRPETAAPRLASHSYELRAWFRSAVTNGADFGGPRRKVRGHSISLEPAISGQKRRGEYSHASRMRLFATVLTDGVPPAAFQPVEIGDPRAVRRGRERRSRRRAVRRREPGRRLVSIRARSCRGRPTWPRRKRHFARSARYRHVRCVQDLPIPAAGRGLPDHDPRAS